MSSRVKTLTVRNLLNALVEISAWEVLGTNLGIKQYKLQAIERNKRGDLAQCKLALFDLWLRSDTKASWEKLIEALTAMEDCDTIIEQIQAKYIPGGGGGRMPSSVEPMAGVEMASANSRVEPDDARFGIRQPIVAKEKNPEEEIMHAQRLIEDISDGSPESRLLTFVNNFASSKSLDLNAEADDNGNTLLHLACRNGDMAIVRALVALGADVNNANRLNLTPADMAGLSNKKEAQKFIKDVGGLESREKKFVNSAHLPIQEQYGQPAMEAGDEHEDSMRPEEVGLIGGGHMILSLDYSSTMAIVQLEVLSQLERVTGRCIRNQFEWIVASGVGGFLMMAMVYANKSISDLRRIYYQLHERVFSNQKPEQRGQELERFAVEIFSSSKRMSDLVHDVDEPKLLIGAVNKSSTNLNPVFFTNIHGDNSTMHVWKVARYTCSSPLYIGESDDYIDGGAISKNPSIFAFSIIREQYRLQSVDLSGIVSVGDGRMPGMALAKLDKHNYHSHFHLSTVNALSEQISQAFASICEARHMRYHRFNPVVDEYIPIPEEAKLEQLINAVIRTIAQCQSQDDSELQKVFREFNNH